MIGAVGFPIKRAATRIGLGASLIALTACGDFQMPQLDADLRGFGRGFSTADAARGVSAPRPASDDKGIISYSDYQVAEARKGDTIGTLAARVGLPEAEVANYNGLKTGTKLREGEIIALPRRVQAENVDVTALAGNALDRVQSQPIQSQPALAAAAQPAEAPVRHQVAKGETAYSISRLYGVSVRSLAEWNSLDSALTVRQGQYLLIPTTQGAAPVAAAPAVVANAPGLGTPTPLPPSAAAPLPAGSAKSAAQTQAETPSSPNMASARTSSSAMSMPADGKVVGAYVKGKSDGIDIAAPAGAPVKAAMSGTVAAITKDTDQVPILVLRHEGNLLTVYAGIDNIAVQKGASVGRGQTIAQVRKTDSPALHFQVRKGTASVDPLDYLN